MSACRRRASGRRATPWVPHDTEEGLPVQTSMRKGDLQACSKSNERLLGLRVSTFVR
jgi:hypothetical protein